MEYGRRWRGSRAAGAMMALGACALLGAACAPSAANETVVQTVVEMGDAIGALQQADGDLQQQLDSLRTVVARQDTIIRRIANLAGVPIP